MRNLAKKLNNGHLTHLFKIRLARENRVKIIVKKTYKSISSGINFEAPSFCVITGKNGSGKSHILEAIADKNFTEVFVDDIKINNIQHIGFNSLKPEIIDNCQAHQITDHIIEWWHEIKDIYSHYTDKVNASRYTESFTHFLKHQENPHRLTPDLLKILELTGKGVYEITEADVAKYINAITTNYSSLFSAQLAVIIKLYHYRQEKNELAEFRASKYGTEKHPFLTQSDFLKMYGPPPWELINEILARANLPYEISNPHLKDFELPYEARLINRDNNVVISIDDLSSGEKVLMSLATAIYRTTEQGNIPDLLLLDEPDAALHPQFSKLLIEVLTETFVKKAGIRVIITTHSPSTVAMAPNDSVFEIDKTTRTPIKVRNSDAVRTLTEGVEFLRISYESRRLIFVEHKNDVMYYNALFNASSSLHNFTFQPVFIEPHSGSSNCTDVETITKNIRSAGLDLAWGIIDYDNKNKSTDSVIVLGGGARYTMENYILDPLYVCLCLIRSSKKTFSDFGVYSKTNRYPDSAHISQQDCQTMVDNLLIKIGIPLNDITPTKLENNFVLNYPKSFLLAQGHNYEKMLNDTFPELGTISRGKGDAGLKLGVLEVIMDYPQFMPIEISDTFSKILGPKI